MNWKERDGAPLHAKPGAGFGLKLIEREASYNLGGAAEIAFPGEGLEVRLTIPADEKMERDASA